MHIEKGVPIPTERAQATKWPFADMDVNDCVKISDGAAFARARVYINGMVQPKTGFKFTTRTINGVLHVWRIA